MEEFLLVIIDYLKGKIFVIASGIISLLIFIMVLWLYELPLEPIVYAVILSVAVFSIIALISFVYYYKRHLLLYKLKKNIVLPNYIFPHPRNLIEKDYQEIIKEIDRYRLKIVNEKNKSYSDMMDYFTIWAHQIKTPIAAMRLILQSEKSEFNDELLEQLFKTEQYVEMVMQYLRLEDMNSDLVFKKYSLDFIIKQAVRKYSKLFIRKKIKLNYENLNIDVLTDEKWIVFVLEQILSNSLKYTNSGEISIYMDEAHQDTLVVEDTGIGIEPEDLPRVFEKGFTGYNGRRDKKSTGIGLYLCKQILNKLSHTIEIESHVGKGTKIKVNFHVNEVNFE
jgi:signal transduction histidine kinase